MPRDRSRRRAGTRRRVLLRAGIAGAAAIGIGAAAGQTGAFTAVSGDRKSKVDVSTPSDALVGILGRGPVQRNSREAMADITNNTAATRTFTVSLQTCSDGTLYDNDGESGCSVTFTLGVGNTKTVDLEASVTGTIPYEISVSESDFSFSTTKTVESQSGNVQSAVDVRDPDKDSEFTANSNTDDWDIAVVDVRDNDGDNDLDRVEFEVKESSTGDVVGTKTVSNIPGDKYAPAGRGDETIQPDDGNYSVAGGTQYTLTTTGYDADGNFDSTSVNDTA